MKGWWVVLLTGMAFGQTTVTIPSTVAVSGYQGFGMNMGAGNTYGNLQILKILTANRNLSFQPQTWEYMSVCAGGDTTHWIDVRENGSSPQPANWFQNATYEVKSGANIGATGVVTASTAQSGGAGATYTLSPALASACSSSNPDMIVLRLTDPAPSWVGYQTPTSTNAYFGTTGTTAALNYETTDLHTGTLSPQALEITAINTGITAGVDYPYDNLNSWINLNGSYTASGWAKCKSGSVNVLVQRGSQTPYVNQNVTLTCNSTAGQGWVNFSFPFTAAETGTQTGGLAFTITSGPSGSQDVIVADLALTEGSNISGNTTVYRDAVYRKIIAAKPGMLRYMDGGFWTCTFDNMIQPLAGMTPCGFNGYSESAPSGLSYSFPDFLNAANVFGAAPFFTMPIFATVTDYQHLAQWLVGNYGGNTTNWAAIFAAKGQNIYIEAGNEVWNQGNAGANMDEGQGSPYGTNIGNLIAAFKGVSGHPTNVKFIGSGRPGGQFTFCDHELIAAAAVTGGQMDFCDAQGYQFSNMTQTASDTAVYQSMVQDFINNDTTASGYPNCGSLACTVEWNKNTYGVGTAVYETNMTPPNILTSTNQTTVNQYIAGLGAGLATTNHIAAQGAAGIPISNFFIISGATTSLTACTTTTGGCGSSSVNAPLWGANWFMASGPAQSGFTDVDRPFFTAFNAASNALQPGALLAVTQAGTPTVSLGASQPDPTNSGANSIAANAAVPLVNCYASKWLSGAIGLACWNWSTSSQVINFSGSNAPSGTVVTAVVGGTGQNPDNNCEGTALGGTCPANTIQAGTLTNPTADTLQPYSLKTYLYTPGGSTAGGTQQGGMSTVGGISVIQ